MSSGFWSGDDGKNSTPTCSASVFSCSIAAGRYTSAETTRIFFFWVSFSSLDSLPTVVVLPAPCRPAISTIAGGTAARFSASFLSPISRTSSSLTMPISAWPGVRLPITSWPSARSLTCAMKVLTTGSATSASNKASRTSRRASWILVSLMRA
ncbi:hypothetical protein D3C85_1375590 [compost metagenome]